MLDRVTRIPFDLDAAFTEPDWRKGLAWPVALAEFRDASRQPLAGLTELVSEARAEDRPVLLLAGPLVTFFARQLVDAALVLQRAEEQGLSVAGRGKMAGAIAGDEAMRERLMSEWTGWGREEPSRNMVLRRIGRVASWSSPLTTLKAMVAPDAMAVSHNGLLIAGAKRAGAAIGYQHAEAMLAAARAGARPQDHGVGGGPELERRLIEAVTAVPQLDAQRLESIRELIAGPVSSWMARAREDLAALRGFRFPARALWSATGGKHASRALGLEAMRQGLTVRRFEHVGTGCLIADGLGFDMTERAVSTEVVVPTDHLARFAENIRTKALEPLGKLIPGEGDPDFVFPAVARPRSARPRVVYATTLLRRHMQYHDGLLADAIYLDWQMRVAEALAAMSVEATLKPHPESHYPGGVNPLPSVAAMSNAPFEKLIPETDVFVFDFGQTTTFWKGLATAQPVVYLDLGLTVLQPEVRAALEKRATVIKVAYDDRNRPVLDAKALADAIASAKPAGADNPFRQWLGGAAP